MNEPGTASQPESENKTLASLFAADSAEFAALQPEQQMKAEVAKDLEQMGPGLIEAFTFAAALAVLYEALDVALMDIVKSSWTTMAELQAYRDPEKHPPEETSWVKLGRHKITSEHKPAVEVFFNGKRLGELQFDAKLTLNVTDARLRVQGGRIREVTGPVFVGETSISYKGFVLLKKNVKRHLYKN